MRAQFFNRGAVRVASAARGIGSLDRGAKGCAQRVLLSPHPLGLCEICRVQSPKSNLLRQKHYGGQQVQSRRRSVEGRGSRDGVEIRTPKTEIRNPRPETRNLKFKVRGSTFKVQGSLSPSSIPHRLSTISSRFSSLPSA